MNASFRTAFWALCLGLSVPMVLFIGVELMWPGTTPRRVAVAVADRNERFRTRQTVSGKSTKEGLQTAGSDPQVVLGPELEPDLATGDLEPGKDHRVPAVVAHTRPKVRILPDIEPVPENDGPAKSAIEERLAGIQTDLDKIGRTLDAQIQRDAGQREAAQREPPFDAVKADPVKQVTELLRQFQEARERVALSPPEERETRTPSDENHDASDAGKRPATLPPDAAGDTKPHERNQRDRESRPQLVTRIYRPRYLSGSALQSLVEPLLTRDLGKTGAADADSGEPATSGRNSSGSPANALVVRDVPEVMRKIDELIARIDVPPTQVSLEAVVITLQLNANLPHGIDLRGFNSSGQSFAISPVDGGPVPLATGGLTLTGGFGLKCGVVTGDPQAFIRALESSTQVRSARAWQMTVVNRQSAGLMLEAPFGSAASGHEFAAGTILKIRPIVDRTGADRSGKVQLDIRRDAHLDGPASGNGAAALTHQIALQAGQTAVVGGFFAEQSGLQYYRRSGLGQLPLVGGLFLKEVEVVERFETIVLLTPHVNAPFAEADSQFVRKEQPPPDQPATPPPTIQASHASEASAEKTAPAPLPASPPKIRPLRRSAKK